MKSSLLLQRINNRRSKVTVEDWSQGRFTSTKIQTSRDVVRNAKEFDKQDPNEDKRSIKRRLGNLTVSCST
ncbi:hypothetical protein MSG28_007788 [Choristoneura fumiferana]|uniref:Uncharacterized protein n=1 Tax=Choristoneura fumiferana TaxID=7141 RepID=A0ACC0JZ62_CHOFU|nr:hypothetical protein MSG28_007788 [Choristoneura fumiferana]